MEHPTRVDRLDPYNIQRLKHAWARGARIQFQWFDEWRDDGRGTFPPNGFLRIHPADAHLEYGPLSSMLRALALDTYDLSNDAEYYAAYSYFQQLEAEWLDFHNYIDDELREFQMLFIAEQLADEGL